MRNSSPIELWRTTPPVCRSSGLEAILPLASVFASGRQALSQALVQSGLCRPKRVACPDWSSHCVLSAVGRCATPIPMKEVIGANLPVDAVLLYEQWGWPFVSSVWPKLAEHFGGRCLIWDRVDSADFLSRKRLPIPTVLPVAEVISLSKLLGLPGGGLLRYGSGFETYRPEPNSVLTECLLASTPEIRDSLACHEYFKNTKQALHPSLRDWLEANSLSGALQMEGAARQRNLRTLLQSPLTRTWEPWMKVAIDDGALPGIAPLLRGARRPLLEALAQRLLQTHNLAVTVYHFNWSGDPLAPNYEPCLPLPTHGMAPDMESVLAELTSVGGA